LIHQGGVRRLNARPTMFNEPEARDLLFDQLPAYAPPSVARSLCTTKCNRPLLYRGVGPGRQTAAASVLNYVTQG
jgi:hypothetical protein